MKKAKVTTEDFDLIMHTLLDKIVLVPFEDFESEYQHAIEVMKAVDENDAPFLAVGIALGIGHIWTEDRHFQKQDLIRVCSTHDLIGMI